ncbi:MAG: L,D-transpeptidase family protein [Bacteroidales bacterium]|nr:L,D-transpeptidase family protein [Bacteroidales bacterium]MBN2817742.1 L,D-transpeptidase family protein [Bacteroidales bacterium]
MNGINEFSGKSNQPGIDKVLALLKRSFQFFTLFALMVLLAGHENSNPKFDNSLVDFYLEQTSEQIQTQSKILLLNSNADSTGFFEDYINKLTVRFYELNDYRPAWTYNYNTTNDFEILVNFVDSLDYLGIPNRYANTRQIKKLVDKLYEYRNDEQLNYRIALEIHATRLMFKTILLVNRGIFIEDKSPELADLADSIAGNIYHSFKNNDLKNALLNTHPDFIPYSNTIRAISVFIDNRRTILTYGTDTLENSSKLLAQGLYYAGILNEPNFDSVHTREIILKNIQKKFGFIQTGKVDQQTYQKIVYMIEKRYYQVCLNIDRLRKISNNSADYIFVNIPSFSLLAVQENKPSKSFNVVVGKKSTPTPIISSKINKIVANPYWTVPKSIVTNEMLHRIRKDSTFLKRNGYMVINNWEEEVPDSLINWSLSDPLGNKYWIRQKNGNKNALGQVKFLFPNDYKVYLHDTPSKKLFEKSYRAYSHGCVRLENPDQLAQHILSGYTKNSYNIRQLINKKEPYLIDLPVEIPIHIQYLTCLGNENGELEFYEDIYDKDDEQLKHLFSAKQNI